MADKKSIVVDSNKDNSTQSSQLEALLVRMEQLESQSKSDKQTIDKLMKVADKTRLHRLEDHKPKGKAVSLCLYNGNVVTSWEITKDIVEKNMETKKMEEDQQIMLHFEDEKSVEIPYLYFTRRKKSTGKINAKVSDFEGEITYTVEYESRKYEINEKFVNA